MRSNSHGNFGYEGHKLASGGSTQGIGIQQANTVIANYAVSSRDEPVYIPAHAILCLKYDQGLTFQAVGCDIEVSYTNENWVYACSTEANKNNLIHWCNTQSIAQDTITECNVSAFTAMRIMFKGKGICYMAAR